jgi:hypothetical protein
MNKLETILFALMLSALCLMPIIGLLCIGGAL